MPWLQPRQRVWALILFWVLESAPNSVGNTAQQSFLADIFPVAEREKAFAARNAWNTGAAMVTVLVAGWVLDYLLPYPQGYQILFFLSFVTGLVEIWLFLRMRDPHEGAAKPDLPETPDPAPARSGTGWQTLVRVFRYRPFLAFLCCSIPFHFTWQMPQPAFTRYEVTNLGMDNTWLSLATVSSSLSAVIAYPLLARKAERVGNLRMLAKSSIRLALAPVLTALCPSPIWVVIANLFIGIGMAGCNLFVLNSLLDIAPPEERPAFLSVHTALIDVSYAIAPLVGAWLITALNARNALILSTVARIATGSGFFLLLHRQRRQQGRIRSAA